MTAKWGSPRHFSIAVPARSFTYDDPCRPQQSPVQGIALLNYRQHRIRRVLLALLDRNGLMPLRIEGLARGVDDLDAALLEGAVQLPQCGLSSFQQGGAGIGGAGIDPGLQGIADGDQLLREALDGELARVFNLALAA